MNQETLESLCDLLPANSDCCVLANCMLDGILERGSPRPLLRGSRVERRGVSSSCDRFRFRPLACRNLTRVSFTE